MTSNDETFIQRSRAIAAIVSTAHKLYREVTHCAKTYKLTESQYNALRILRGAERRGEQLTQADLADRLIASRANTTWILDRLEERKLIARKGHTDRRKNLVELTPTGVKLLAKIDPEFDAMMTRILGHVDTGDLHTLMGTLGSFKFE